MRNRLYFALSTVWHTFLPNLDGGIVVNKIAENVLINNCTWGLKLQAWQFGCSLCRSIWWWDFLTSQTAGKNFNRMFWQPFSVSTSRWVYSDQLVHITQASLLNSQLIHNTMGLWIWTVHHRHHLCPKKNRCPPNSTMLKKMHEKQCSLYFRVA